MTTSVSGSEASILLVIWRADPNTASLETVNSGIKHLKVSFSFLLSIVGRFPSLSNLDVMYTGRV